MEENEASNGEESKGRVLLQEQGPGTGHGIVDSRSGKPRSNSRGGATAAAYILGFMCLSSTAMNGVSSNLVMYLKNWVHFSNASAASVINIWNCVGDFSPLFGAYVADGFLGRYKATLAFFAVLVLGCGLLDLSAFFYINPLENQNVHTGTGSSSVKGLLFVSLAMLAIGRGFASPVLAFGADQFDENDERESVQKGSFFNWYFFSISAGSMVGSLVLVSVGEKTGYNWAFATCTAGMVIGLLILVGANRKFRFKGQERNPFLSIIRVLFAAAFKSGRSQKSPSDETSVMLLEINPEEQDQLCIMEEDVKCLCRLLPIWVGSIFYEMMEVQTTSLFVEQAAVMDRRVGNLIIPSASLICFHPGSIAIWTILFDRVIQPSAARLLGNPRGLSSLHRMGIGLLIMLAAMISTAVVETVRLEIVDSHHLSESEVAAPMSVLWQIPQFTLVGASRVFYFIGLTEFLYNQLPESMRTLGTALSFLPSSIGNFCSGLLIALIASVTTGGDRPGWIPANLNLGHLNYFFWLLSAITLLNFFYFIFSARSYNREKKQLEKSTA